MHQREFDKGEVIWAKIRGYPWWPAVVSTYTDLRNPDTLEVVVNFIGENSHAKVGDDKIAKFDEKLEEYINSKNKKLADSIEAAQRIIKGESTYENEWQRIEMKNRRVMERGHRKASSSSSGSRERKQKQKKEVDEMKPQRDLPRTLLSKRNPNKAVRPPPSTSPKVKHLVSSERIQLQRALEESLKEKQSSSNRQKHDKKTKHHNKPTESRKIRKLEQDDEIPLQTLPSTLSEHVLEFDTTPKPTKPLRSLADLERDLLSHITDLLLVMESGSQVSSESVQLLLQDLTESSADKIIDEITHMPNIHCNPRLSKMTYLLDNLVIPKLQSTQPSHLEVMTQLKNACTGLLETMKTNYIRKIFDYTELESEIIGAVKTRCVVEPTQKQPEAKIEIESNIEIVTEEDEQSVKKRSRARKIIDYEDDIEYKTPTLSGGMEHNACLNSSDIGADISKQSTPIKHIDQEVPDSRGKMDIEQCSNPSDHNESKHESEHSNNIMIIDEGCLSTAGKIEEERCHKSPVHLENISPSTNDENSVGQHEYHSKAEETFCAKTYVVLPQEKAINPDLRKRICKKMAKMVQERYNIDRELSQSIAINNEYVVRQLDPEMQENYKNKVYIFMKLLKSNLITKDILLDNDVSKIKEILHGVHSKDEISHLHELGLMENDSNPF